MKALKPTEATIFTKVRYVISAASEQAEPSKNVSITPARLNRLGISAELFEPDHYLLPQARLLLAIIARAILDATSRPHGTYRHRQDRSDARKWLWNRSDKQHGYGWAASLIGWGDSEIEEVHRHVFPNGTIDG